MVELKGIANLVPFKTLDCSDKALMLKLREILSIIMLSSKLMNIAG